MTCPMDGTPVGVHSNKKERKKERLFRFKLFCVMRPFPLPGLSVAKMPNCFWAYRF